MPPNDRPFLVDVNSFLIVSKSKATRKGMLLKERFIGFSVMSHCIKNRLNCLYVRNHNKFHDFIEHNETKLSMIEMSCHT